VVYFGVCLSAPVDLYRAGAMKIQHVIYGVLGAGLMAFVIYGSIVPYPAYPYNFLPPIFVAFIIVGAIWFAILKSKSPGTLRLIAEDMEG
jgi:hypothetical protein